MNRILCLLVALLLVGCQGHAGKTNSEQPKLAVTHEFLHPINLQQYVLNSKKAIEYQFVDIDSYAGKSCTVRIKQLPGEQPLSTTAEGGDPSLCSVALRAIQSAIKNNSFPYKPSGAPDSIPYDFKP